MTIGPTRSALLSQMTYKSFDLEHSEIPALALRATATRSSMFFSLDDLEVGVNSRGSCQLAVTRNERGVQCLGESDVSRAVGSDVLL